MAEHERRWTIWVCPDCGHTNMHADTCGAFPGEPVVHGHRVEVVPASRIEGAVGALEDAAEYLRLAYTWIEDADRHAKTKRAHERAKAALVALRGSSSGASVSDPVSDPEAER